MTGLLLAGGRSTRMGLDKSDVLYRGERLAERGLRILEGVSDSVLVASGDGKRLDRLGLPQVVDANPDAGPLGGIVAGLEAAPTELVAVLAVDMPFANADVYRLLAELMGSADAAIPRTDRGLEPLHAVYARSAAPHLRASLESGALAMHQAVRALTVREVTEDEWRRADPTGRFSRNVNRPEDLSTSPAER